MIQPFLKCAGGKYRLLKTIFSLFPENIERYVEPFVGAGSVALNVKAKEILINDINLDLINVYRNLKLNGVSFIEDARKLFIPENNNSFVYNSLREEFNKTKDSYRKSILFIYLNRHCFNGLCRYNLKGEFNTPIGKYRYPYFPDVKMLEALPVLSNFEIKNEDFRNILNLCKDGDVVYCDPPYVPLSESSSFDDYAPGGFCLKNHLDLAECCFEASRRGAIVFLSNHSNWYTKQIYSVFYGAKIISMNVSRTISSDVEKRNPVRELIAIFQKDIK